MAEITEELLKKVVAEDLGVNEDEVNILSHTTEAGCGVGDGFSCEIKRIKTKAAVNGDEKSLSYIAKLVPEDVRGDFIRKVIASC